MLTPAKTSRCMMWIKHYSNARQSEYMSKLFAEYGWEGYGKYWGLLEYLATNYTGGEPLFHVPRETIRGLFGVRSWSDLQSFVDHLTNERVLNFALCGNVYRINAPILLELQSRDFKRARIERAETAPREEKIRIREDKNKKREDKATSLPDLALLWNLHCGKLPKVEATNSKRNKASKLRLNEHGAEKWVQAIQRASASDFCNGLNDKSWVATFDWILQPDVYFKITEGKYDNRKRTPQAKDLVKSADNLKWATTSTSDVPLLKDAK